LYAANRPELFKYIWGILKNKKCLLYRINAVEDHIHIVTTLHPTTALSNLVKDIKLGSSKFIKDNALFKDFNGWQDGYAAFTYGISAKENLIDYVKNQELHHQTKSFKEELMEILTENGIIFEEAHLD
jgi:putative transposase